MFSKTRIGAVVFTVADIHRSLKFYRDTLGLEIELQKGEGGAGEGSDDWLMGQTDGGVSLIFFKGDPKPGSSPIIVFELDKGGIDSVAAGLAKKGVTLVTPVSHAPGGWTADFADPDGHTISMWQPKEMPR
jgi:glyoxylase I family protein